MSRIAPIDPPYSDEISASFARLMPPGMEPLRLFRTLAHNPRVLRRIQRGGLLDPGSISLRLRELAILRTCYLCGADYEWGVHAALFATRASLDDSDLRAVCAPTVGDRWSEREALVLRLCDALHATADVDETLWAALAARFEPAQLLELVTLAGLYHAVSFIVNATGVEAENWALAMPR
jgi:alkylhydroperoxidase family enzyme